MYHLRKDTLAGIRTSSLFSARDASAQPLPEVMKRLLKYEAASDERKQPEAEALRFYHSNHVFSLISGGHHKHEPLSPSHAALARSYVKMSSDIAVRLAYYCLLIITREARHMTHDATLAASIAVECGAATIAFLVGNTGDEDAAVNGLRQHAPATTVGKYVRAIERIFFEGHWSSSSYGGVKWGVVTSTLLSFITGKITPELFVDTAFALVHNGGPIFNKGMLYHTQETKRLDKLLDVQRSGQVPQFFNGEKLDYVKSNDPINAFANLALSLYHEQLTGHVDWFKVIPANPDNSYHVEKQQQVAKYGAPNLSGNIESMDDSKRYWVSDTESVEIVERKKAA